MDIKNNDTYNSIRCCCKQTESKKIVTQVEKTCNSTTNKNGGDMSICDFLKSQPIPEWIAKSTNSTKMNNLQNESNVERKNCHLPICMKKKKSNNFDKNVEQISKSNSYRSIICEFLQSQPIPEWIQSTKNNVKCSTPKKSEVTSYSMNIESNKCATVNDDYDTCNKNKQTVLEDCARRTSNKTVHKGSQHRRDMKPHKYNDHEHLNSAQCVNYTSDLESKLKMLTENKFNALCPCVPKPDPVIQSSCVDEENKTIKILNYSVQSMGGKERQRSNNQLCCCSCHSDM